MYYALCNNEPVRANEEATKSLHAPHRHYYCPDCGQPVQLVISQRKRPYFKHYGKLSTANNESIWHQENKQWIARTLKRVGIEAVLELPLADGERRADVYVTMGEQPLTIELQLSLITALEVSKRQKDYEAYQIKVIWLLNESQAHYQYRPPNFQSLTPFMRTHDTFGLYLPYWQSDEKRVYLLSVDFFGRMTQRWILSIEDYLAICTSDDAPFEHSVRTVSCPKANRRTMTQLVQQKTRLLRHPTQVEKTLLALLYQHHVSTDILALDYFNYDYSSVFVQEKLSHVLVLMTLLRRLNIPSEDYQRQLFQWLHFRQFNCEIKPYLSQWLNHVWILSKQFEHMREESTWQK